jgi:hypothetical protein
MCFLSPLCILSGAGAAARPLLLLARRRRPPARAAARLVLELACRRYPRLLLAADVHADRPCLPAIDACRCCLLIAARPTPMPVAVARPQMLAAPARPPMPPTALSMSTDAACSKCMTLLEIAMEERQNIHSRGEAYLILASKNVHPY